MNGQFNLYTHMNTTVAALLSAMLLLCLSTPASETVTGTAVDGREGGSGTAGEVRFFFTRTGNTVGDRTLSLSWSGTATSSDWVGNLPTSITIPNGSSIGHVSITIVDDGTDEDTETLICTFAVPPFTPVSVVGSPATGHIFDNDNVISISAIVPDCYEGVDLGTFRLSRTGSTSASLTVAFTTSGTAIGPSPSMDYSLDVGGTAVFTSVTIAAGNSYVDVDVIPWYDGYSEPNGDTVIVTIDSSTAYTAGSPNTDYVTIHD
jgi:hypothetical protein